MTLKRMMVIGLTVAVLSTTAVAAGTLIHSHYVDKNNSSEVVNNGLKVKAVNKGTNAEGKNYFTFSYDVSPADATDKILVDLKFADGSDCGNSIISSIDRKNKTITVTCLEPFNKEVRLRVYVEGNESLNDVVVIDYQAKLTRFDFSTSEFNNKYYDPSNPTNLNGAFTYLPGTNYNHTFDFFTLYNHEVSVGTLEFDKYNYTLTGEIVTPYNEYAYGEWDQSMQTYIKDLDQYFRARVRGAVWDSICEGDFELKNAPENICAETGGVDEQLLTLISISKSTDILNGWDSFKVSNVKITFEDSGQSYDLGDLVITYSLSGMTIPSQYLKPVNSITAEVDRLVF